MQRFACSSLVRFIVVLLASAGASSCASLDGFLFPAEAVDGYDFSESTIPEERIEPEIFLRTDSGEEIHAVWVSQEADAPTVLYCHGNTENIGYYWDRVEIFYRLGVNVLIFDYRGYGRSEGTPTEENTREDARAARQHLRDRGVPDEEVTYYGFSLGAAICLQLAIEDPPEALAMESAFASVRRLMRSGSGLDMGPSWLSSAEYDNEGKVDELTAPLLLMHGVEDDFTPIDHGRIVFANAPEPKMSYWVEGADHSELPDYGGEEYDRVVSDLLFARWPGSGSD